MYQRFVNGELDYRTQIEDGYDPRGPDGQGRNRLGIHLSCEPIVRCVLRPRTRQGALDTLRGMAHHGSPTAYDECVGGPCAACTTACASREVWQESSRVLEVGERVVMEGPARREFRSWEELLRAVDVPALARRQDAAGVFFWTMA